MSDYQCYCEVGEGEPFEWESVTHPRARKEYTCCECKDKIKPGERYEKMVGKFEGELVTYRTCEFCASEYARLNCQPERDWACIAKGELACAVLLEVRGEF